MAPARYTTLTIKNSASVSMFLSVSDADGNTYAVATLASGQETTQFTPVDATWTIKFSAGEAPAATNGDSTATPLHIGDNAGSRGGGGYIK